jgi:hypothetical protein
MVGLVELFVLLKEPLHHSGEAGAVRSGWAGRRLFEGNSRGKTSNAVDRSSPINRGPQGAMEKILMLRLLSRRSEFFQAFAH